MYAFKRASGMLAKGGKIVIVFEYDGESKPRNQITTVVTEVDGMKSETELKDKLPGPIHAEGKDILKKLYDIGETFFSASVSMVMKGEKMGIFDMHGKSMKLDKGMVSRIRHLMQAILKFHGTYESYMLNNAFIIGDFVGGLITADEVSTTEKYGG